MAASARLSLTIFPNINFIKIVAIMLKRFFLDCRIQQFTKPKSLWTVIILKSLVIGISRGVTQFNFSRNLYLLAVNALRHFLY
jgi:hypothetical protein